MKPRLGCSSPKAREVVLADVLDEQGETLAKELGDGARFVHLDVSDEHAWPGALASTIEAFGHVDVLVNNAAVHHVVTLENETVDGFERMFRVNLLGTFLGMRSCASELRKSGHASIVNICQPPAWSGSTATARTGHRSGVCAGSRRSRRSSSVPRSG